MIGVVRTILIDLCVVCSCLILSGCSWIYDNHYCCEINEEEGSFDVFSDWHECPDADPAGMAYMFFPVSGGEPWRFDFPKKDGGPLMLPDGVFHVLSFNDDTSRVLFGNEGDYSKFYCYCRETGLYNGLLTAGPGEVIGAAVTEEGEKVMEAPDEMWGECVEWFSLEASGVELRRKEDDPEISYSDRILLIYPHLLTPRYSYVVSDISNLSGVARMCASLSGMSPSLELATEEPSGEHVTLPLAAERSGEGEVSGSIYTFGPAADEDTAHKLTLYFWLVDGNKFKYEFDVSRQILEAPDKMDVILKVGGIELPESGPPAGDGAFDVTVDGWNTYILSLIHI